LSEGRLPHAAHVRREAIAFGLSSSSTFSFAITIMKLSHKLLLGYLFIGLLFAVHERVFGMQPAPSWGTCFGHGLVWPAVLVPGLGKLIGGVLIVAFVVAMVL
jgi:hypothetical protein